MTRDEIVALLRSWHDHFPFPATWTGELQRRSATPGPAPFRREECGDCGGRGKRGNWPCRRCEGAGSYEVDGYTGQIVRVDDATWQELLSDVVDCDRCGGWGRLGAHAETRPDRSAPLCPNCEGTGKVPAPLARGRDVERARERQGDRALDALADEHDQHERLRCYRELARAMQQLRERRPGVHFLVCWTYVLEAGQPSPANAAGLEAGLAFLERRLEQVRAPGFVRRQAEARRAVLARAKGRGADTRAQTVRNDEIRRRHVDGESPAALAAAFALHVRQVARILAGR